MQQKVIKRAAPQLGNTNKLVYDFFPFENYFNAKYEIKQKARKKTHTKEKKERKKKRSKKE